MPKKRSGRRRVTQNKKRTKLAGPKAAMRARKPASGRRAARNKRRKRIRGNGAVASPVGSARLEQNRSRVAAAGQSGDIEGLSNVARSSSESVVELAEEGQPFEAEVLAGVERAEGADESEVTTHEVLEDDVPSEYDDER